MRNSTLAVTALLLATNTVPAATPGLAAIDQMIPVMCPALVQQIGSRAEIFVALKEKGVNGVAICTCANERFTKDGEIARITAVKTEELQSRITDPAVFTSYIAVRAMQNILSCLAEDMDRQLAGVSLPLSTPAPVPAPAQ